MRLKEECCGGAAILCGREKRCANEKINVAFILGFFHTRDMFGILKTNKGDFVFVQECGVQEEKSGVQEEIA